jgi:hypothetical protein
MTRRPFRLFAAALAQIEELLDARTRVHDRLDRLLTHAGNLLGSPER